MPTLDWKHYTIAALLLAALAAWGSREVTSIHRTEELSSAINALKDEKKTLETRATDLERQVRTAQDTAEEIVPVQMPNGQIAYTTRRTSRTVQETIQRIREEARIEVAQVREELAKLQAAKRTEDKETVKAAPKWAMAAAWDPYAEDPLARYRLGPGMNIGPLTGLATLAPAAIGGAIASGAPASEMLKAMRPQLEAVLRF